MAFSGKFKLAITAAIDKTVEMVTPAAALSDGFESNLAENTDADTFMTYDNTALGTSSSETFTLDDDSLSDALGDALSFATIFTIILINNNDAGEDNIKLSGTLGVLTGTTPKMIVPPQGCCAWCSEDGIAVGAGETLVVENPDAVNTASYELIIIGEAA